MHTERDAVDRAVAVVRGVGRRTSDGNVTFLAAGVAYYGFVSLLPAAVLALVVAVSLGGQRLANAVIGASSGILTDAGQAVLVGALVDGPGQGSVTLISLPLTLWGALKVFRGLDVAFSRVYGVDGNVGLVDQVKDSLVVVGSIGGGLVAMLVLGAAVDVGPVVEAIGLLALPALLTLAFLPLYYVFPDVDVGLREVLPGAVFAGVGWTLLRTGFQAYVELQSGGDGETAVYGTLGAILLLVTFLYLGATLVLVGAVVNVVLTDDRGGDADRAVDTSEGRRVADGGDRQGKGPDGRAEGRMSGETADTDAGDDEDDGRPAPDLAELDGRVAELRADLDAIDDRTVDKPALEAELKRYVRARMRRGHARGWGPYLVLLYGTAMVLGGFYFLRGWVAIAAMLVSFLSTLGLYTLFVLVGVGLNAVEVPGRALDAVRERR